MTLQLEEATRQGLIPLIGVYGKSGSGKTHSALLLARGLAGPDKPIAIIDTERKRSGALVGLIPGGFKRINLEAPFTPETYSEAIAILEREKMGAGVIDSMSHEWDGEGGILEMQEDELQRMAGDNFSKREACKMAAWIKPKFRHKALIQHILRCNIPLVCCLRGQEKTHIEKKDGEKTKVTTDDFSTPIYDSRFIFEMLVNLETVQRNDKPGCVRVTKSTHPDLLACLPKDGEQVGVTHGAGIARWCAMGGDAPASADGGAIQDLKRQLWSLLAPVRGEAANWLQAQRWLWDECCMDPSEAVARLDEKQLRAVIAAATKKVALIRPPK